MPTPDELDRLRPDLDVASLALPVFWTEAYTPWSAEGAVGVAVLDELAAAAKGIIAHA
ncbi:hypothetical protein [Microbacterium sp. LWH10-1.2]|uniref:hypothetical protein n=1 Tax=Microbacterium sp. LWH10-1.2 TaxID=3135255 RepID=UPI00313992E9